MPVGIGSTQITGISVVANSTDAASKSYVDSASSGGGLPSIIGNENEFLRTDGSSTSWELIGAYQEYTTAGTYSFTVPIQATDLLIEATGAGGGGASGIATNTSYVNKAEFWFLRTSGTTSSLGALQSGVGPNAIYDGNNYIVTGGSGTIAISTDAISWSFRTSGFGAGNTIYGIAYASNLAEKYLIYGTSGISCTSTDAISWTLRTAGFGTSAINSIFYGNGFYIAGEGVGGFVRSSTDGISWITRTSPSSSSIQTCFYANGYYIVAGGSQHIRVSTDTINWVLRTSGKVTQVNYSTTFGNGIFLIGDGGGGLMSSTDTIVWSQRGSPFGAQAVYSAHFGEGYFVVSANSGVTSVSVDTISWTSRTTVTTFSGSAAYGNGIHIKFGNGGQIAISPYPKGFSGSGGGGGATIGWKFSKSNISSSSLTINVGSGGTANTAGAATTISWTSSGGTFSITANGGSGGVNTATNNLLPGGAGGTIPATPSNYLYANAGTAGGNGGYFESSTINRQGASSSDATNATLAYQATGGGGGTSADLTGQFGKFGGTIYYGYGNTLQTSKTVLLNGTSSVPFSSNSYGAGGNGGGAQFGPTAWVIRTSGFGTTAYALGYGSGIYIMAGSTGRLSTSTDTITWILRTCGFGANNVLGHSYDGTNHVVYGNNGTITASTNGIVWSLRTSSTTNGLGNLGNTYPGSIYANGLHMTTGLNGTFLLSTDSISWTLRTTSLGANNGWAVSYGNSVYMISTNAILVTSTDNITWTLRTSGTINGLNSLQYLSPRYYYFSNGSNIFSSTDAIIWTNTVSTINGLYSSAVSNNSLITSGASSLVYSSVDGLTWILRTSNIGATNAFASAYGNGLFLNVYGSGQLIVADSSFVGSGGNGFRGGGGGGGGYNTQSNTTGSGGVGGDGYVRISWS